MTSDRVAELLDRRTDVALSEVRATCARFGLEGALAKAIAETSRTD